MCTSVENNATTIKGNYNESENIIEGYDIVLTPIIAGMVPVIGIESYTRHNLAPGICSLIKPAAVEKSMPFPATIHTIMLWLRD